MVVYEPVIKSCTMSFVRSSFIYLEVTLKHQFTCWHCLLLV